ncbi:MAG: isoprenylcysteine carboxylmethyltransferase family protein [Anaerolineales bacterium]|nr:isoprenylcysteine carboxylmethyltransferase family protein [Anaerolineales bacterium]
MDRFSKDAESAPGVARNQGREELVMDVRNNTETGAAASSGETGPRMDAQTRRGVIRWLARESMGIFMVAVTLFWPAGTLNWAWGWALVLIYAVWTIANGLILYSRSPDLLAERATRRAGGKKWDVAILSVVGLLTIAKHVLAGLDFRYAWSVGIPSAVQAVALVLAALGYALGTWSMAVNAFFSLVVRIQDDRGHIVVSSGPYRYLRHPGYLGTIVFELVTPLMLGSWWALIPGGLGALLFVVRTALEDHDLLVELAGYDEYTHKVRFRLLPGIW